MKKLGINTAAAIMDIIGASFYLLAIMLAVASEFITWNNAFLTVTNTIIRLFSVAGCIVVFIAYIKSKKVQMPLSGQIMGFIGHLLYALFHVYLALAGMVLCILGAVFTFRNNLYILHEIST